ncbi:hypothetical protein F3K20_26875 [Streptomyces scabiei]|nr:hypothetical protein [Streptomyces sp. LBUM 1484]MBP5877738.1 hypothetical protein [Streptomyces sp. LBUM 1477]MBP5885574.1 hypothetical protein [Streptomyces sp. LBUM 1487]MBP5901549.1 hypothetical protein [Streptomyces sp. LBUM 1488]QTU51179.1 hypothetical protein F3K20_26875 [Streptomyces sp. LBUM 1482]QTU67338.1 hypothetical protein F3K22_25770 [Streptomyces sp. LBUM 1475]
MRGRGVARGGQEGVLPRARTHYARTGPSYAQREQAVPYLTERPGREWSVRRCSSEGMPLVTGRGQLTGSAKGQCSHLAH